MPNFNYRNNVIVPLDAATPAGAVNVSLDLTKSTLVPDGAQSTIGVFEEIDGDGVVTRRECVLVTNRSGGNITVVRKHQPCPENDAATTHVQTSFPFSPVNGARLVLTVTRLHLEQIENDIDAINASLGTDFLTIADYVAGNVIGAESSTGTDAYAITLPDVTAYADRQRFFVRFDVGNTADATLKINSLLVKPILKLDGQALETGDIDDDMTTILEYNSVDDAFRIIGTLANYDASIVVSSLTKEAELGEDIVAGDNAGLVFFGEGIQVIGEQPTSPSNLKIGDTAPTAERSITINSSLVPRSLQQLSLDIRMVGTTTDDLELRFIGPVGYNETITIPAGSITNSYVTQNITIPRIPFGDDRTIVIAKLGAIDAVNHYEVKGAVASTAIGGLPIDDLSTTPFAGIGSEWTTVKSLEVPERGNYDIDFDSFSGGAVSGQITQAGIFVNGDLRATFTVSTAGSTTQGLTGENIPAGIVEIKIRSENVPLLAQGNVSNFIIDNGFYDVDVIEHQSTWGFETNKLYRSDFDDQGTQNIDGILEQSGLVTETKPITIEGCKLNATNDIGAPLYISENNQTVSGNLSANFPTPFVIGFNAAQASVGQSFEVLTTAQFVKLAIPIQQIGAPTGNLIANLYSDAGITLIATSNNKVAENTVVPSVNTEFYFGETLVPGTYFIEITVDRGLSGTNYTQCAASTVAYDGDKYTISNVGAWSITGADVALEITLVDRNLGEFTAQKPNQSPKVIGQQTNTTQIRLWINEQNFLTQQLRDILNPVPVAGVSYNYIIGTTVQEQLTLPNVGPVGPWTIVKEYLILETGTFTVTWLDQELTPANLDSTLLINNVQVLPVNNMVNSETLRTYSVVPLNEGDTIQLATRNPNLAGTDDGGYRNFNVTYDVKLLSIESIFDNGIVLDD